MSQKKRDRLSTAQNGGKKEIGRAFYGLRVGFYPTQLPQFPKSSSHEIQYQAVYGYMETASIKKLQEYNALATSGETHISFYCKWPLPFLENMPQAFRCSPIVEVPPFSLFKLSKREQKKTSEATDTMPLRGPTERGIKLHRSGVPGDNSSRTIE